MSAFNYVRLKKMQLYLEYSPIEVEKVANFAFVYEFFS